MTEIGIYNERNKNNEFGCKFMVDIIRFKNNNEKLFGITLIELISNNNDKQKIYHKIFNYNDIYYIKKSLNININIDKLISFILECFSNKININYNIINNELNINIKYNLSNNIELIIPFMGLISLKLNLNDPNRIKNSWE